jgi:hypothetical protein
LVVPVPGGAAYIGGVSVVGLREDAGPVTEIVSLVASEASSVGVVSFALVTHSNTGLFSIESPSLGAGKADLVVPIPGSAS